MGTWYRGQIEQQWTGYLLWKFSWKNPKMRHLLRQGNWLNRVTSCTTANKVSPIMSVGRHQAFEFFKPVEDDVDLAGLAAFYWFDHQKALAVGGDVVV